MFVADTRVLNALVLTLNGEEPQALRGYASGPGSAYFSACLHIGREPDPTLLVERRRSVTGIWHEQIRITNHRVESMDIVVGIDAAADFAYIFDVKHGQPSPSVPGRRTEGGVQFDSTATAETALLRLDPMPDPVSDATEDPLSDPASDAVSDPATDPVAERNGERLTWRITLPSQSSWQLAMSLVTGSLTPAGELVAGSEGDSAARRDVGTLARPLITCSDVRFERLIDRSIVDLESLLIRDGEARYFAAGTPWFLTLFGRDSLWSSLMALPLGVEVLGETLQLLARHQGVQHDPVTEEAPGKILHEVRHGTQVDRGDLPPLYYGTIDATPLFVIAVERAWRWGLDADVVAALLPHVERALAWMRDDGDSDGSGFLRYSAHGARRLANQGWKDSEDGICFADGTLASAPIALCEVQGYAYQAAIAGAALLDALGGDGEAWRAWAANLRERFQAAFWVEDEDGGFPALALDGGGRQVDSITSNAGHLLGTGILEPEQRIRIAGRLAATDMDSGWGLRTLSSDSPRFNPLSYHGGSVWPHDTAIAIDGLARVAAGETASHLLNGLVAAGDHLGYRLPELFAGEQRTEGSQPLPYPTACSPQAWSAGAALLALRAIFGIDPDLPAGKVHLRPMCPAPFGRLRVDGIPLAGGRLSLELEDGVLQVVESPDGIEVVIHPDDEEA